MKDLHLCSRTHAGHRFAGLQETTLQFWLSPAAGRAGGSGANRGAPEAAGGQADAGQQLHPRVQALGGRRVTEARPYACWGGISAAGPCPRVTKSALQPFTDVIDHRVQPGSACGTRPASQAALPSSALGAPAHACLPPAPGSAPFAGPHAALPVAQTSPLRGGVRVARRRGSRGVGAGWYGVIPTLASAEIPVLCTPGHLGARMNP